MNSIIRTDGSGRRTVGKMVAGKLGISCYDSEWIEKISSQSGFVPAYMRGTEELRIREKDKRRAAWHRFYTDEKWGDAANYHICLDSGVLGIDRCAELLRMLY